MTEHTQMESSEDQYLRLFGLLEAIKVSLYNISIVFCCSVLFQ